MSMKYHVTNFFQSADQVAALITAIWAETWRINTLQQRYRPDISPFPPHSTITEVWLWSKHLPWHEYPDLAWLIPIFRILFASNIPLLVITWSSISQSPNQVVALIGSMSWYMTYKHTPTKIPGYSEVVLGVISDNGKFWRTLAKQSSSYLTLVRAHSNIPDLFCFQYPGSCLLPISRFLLSRDRAYLNHPIKSLPWSVARADTWRIITLRQRYRYIGNRARSDFR